MQSSVKISREIIINLSENGVSASIFINLLIQSLTDITLSLITWDGSDAMAHLWATVFKVGNIMTNRIARRSSWTARALGFGSYKYQDQDQDDTNNDDNTDHDDFFSYSTAWWEDEISGCPSSIGETVLAFLDSGFHPSSNSILAAKLHEIAKTAVKSSIQKSRVEIPMSCRALIVPGIFFHLLVF